MNDSTFFFSLSVNRRYYQAKQIRNGNLLNAKNEGSQRNVLTLLRGWWLFFRCFSTNNKQHWETGNLAFT